MTADQRAQASLHYTAGARKFDVGKYDEAAEEFVRAYEISGSATVLYNIGLAYRAGEKYEKALTFYKSCKRHTDCAVERRAELDHRIDELTALVSQAKAAAQSPPTGLDPNGQPVHKSDGVTTPPPSSEPPLKPETTPPSSTPPVTTDTQTTAPSTAAPEPAHGPDPALMRKVGIGLGAAGVAFIAVGVGMSLAAMKDSQNVDSASKQHLNWGPNLQASQKNGPLYDTISYVGYGVGAAALIGSAVTLYLGFRTPASGARAQLSPLMGTNVAGLQLTGHF